MAEEVVEPEVATAEPTPAESGVASVKNVVFRLLQDRYVQIGLGVFVFIIVLLIIVGFVVRGGSGNKEDKLQVRKNLKIDEVVFKQLTAMDAAQIREALSYEQIPFVSEKEGRIINIKVPKELANEARIKMAQLGLPEGGIVGFEIFDEGAALGATDYDKRIQYVRAISGELSRIISRMEAINSARVQIVIPEKRPFGEKGTGSASVLLNIKPKVTLTNKQIRGIMHLVASSVEDLEPEFVSVIDNTGQILSDRIKASLLDKRQAFIFDMLTTKTEEEKSPLELLLQAKKQLKDGYEREFNQKVSSVLANLYPKGSYLVYTNVSLREAENSSNPYVISKINIAILVDSKSRELNLTSQLKSSTFSLVAAAVGYQKGRDRILLEKVPFVNIDSDKSMGLFPSGQSSTSTESEKKPGGISIIFKFIYAFVVITIIFVFVTLRFYNFGKNEEEEFEEEEFDDEETQFAVEKFRAFADSNQEQLIKKLTEWML